MIAKLKTLGADVVQIGAHWSEADQYLREQLLAKDDNGVYVPPFDHPDVWAGNASLVDEVEEQMGSVGGYDALVCSVGGGGLFSGIMQGLSQHGRLIGGEGKRVKVLAMETKGAESLNLSVRNGELSRLPAITSIATSLGATQVAAKAYEWAVSGNVISRVLSDAEAAMACVNFADDERILVEPACGVSIAPAYNDSLHSLLLPSLPPDEFAKRNIVLVVCGGSNVTLQILEEYRQKYGNDADVVKKFHTRRLRQEGVQAIPTKVEEEH